MYLLPHLLAFVGLLALCALYKQWRPTNLNPNSKGRKLPPEPSGAWPVIGHLLQLSSHTTLARTLGAMADKYGPVLLIRVGMSQVLVVSNWEAVKECFTTNDIAFASRPDSSATTYLGFNGAAFSFAPYGPFWREMRKLVLLEVLSNRRLETLRHVRVSEIETSIKELFSIINKENSPANVVMSEWFDQLTLNMIVRTIAGKRYTDSEVGSKVDAQHFKKVVKEFMYIVGEFNVSDVIPCAFLRWLDPQGHIKSMKRLFKELDAIMQIWIDEHVEKRKLTSNPGDEQDFIDVLLSVIEDDFRFGHCRETIIKATAMALIIAGSDTTSVHLTWLLTLLLNNRHVMKQAQEEIDLNIGKDRWIAESDIKNLVYLQAIVKEALRLYPPGPVSVPHLAREDCEVSGYHIPKGTRLLVNLWKMHRDPRIWSEPDKFFPERFMTSQVEVDVTGQHFEFTPFGSGRRSCPGITFAMQVTHLTVARLLQGFDFTTPSNLPVDMTEGQGITLQKVTPLEALIVPRLPRELYGC